MSNPLGSLDARFTYAPSDTTAAVIETDVTGIAPYKPIGNYLPVTVRVSSLESGGQTWVYVETLLDGVVAHVSNFPTGCPEIALFAVRVFLWDNQVAVYCNGKLVYTWALAYALWPARATVTLKAIFIGGGDVDFTDIRNVELCDRRDKIAVPRNSSSNSILQNIIGKRPVNDFASWRRALRFTYHATLGTIAAHNIENYKEDHRDGSGLASEAIVEAESLSVSFSEETARRYGYNPVSYPMTDMRGGAPQAAAAKQLIALEGQTGVTLSARFDPRVEAGDELTVYAVASGTGRIIDETIILEDITGITTEKKNDLVAGYRMSLVGRKKES